MVGFGTVFVAASVAFALVIQGFYKPQPLFQKARFADEIIGGFLGLVAGGPHPRRGRSIILDSFFLIPGIPPDPDELPFLRDIWDALDASQIVAGLPRDAHPVLLPADRAVHPGAHRTDVPVGLSVIDRALLERTDDRRRPRADRRPPRPRRRDRAAASGGSSRSRPTSAATTVPRTPASARPPATRSCSGRPARPTCTLSTGCTTASTW